MISQTTDWEVMQPVSSGNKRIAKSEPRRPQLTRNERIKIAFAMRVINYAAKYQGGK